MKIYIDYMDNISVDPALRGKIMKRAMDKPRKIKPTTLRYAGLVATAAVLLLGIWIMPTAINSLRTPDDLPRVTYWTNQGNGDDVAIDADTQNDAYTNDYVSPGSGTPDYDRLMPGGRPIDPSTPQDGLDFNTNGIGIGTPIPPMADRSRIGFAHRLTVEQMHAVFPGIEPGLTAYALYMADGSLIEAQIDTMEDNARRRLQIRAAEGQIGHSMLFMHEDEPIVSYVYGVEVTATIFGSEDFALLTADFMLDNIAYHVSIHDSIESGTARLTEIVNQLILGGAADLSVLADPVIPELRNDMLTLEEAQRDPDFGVFLPAYVPDRFSFDMANRWIDQQSNNLFTTWMNSENRYSNEYIRWIVSKEAWYHAERFVSAGDTHKFDRSLFQPPYADTVPEEFWQIHWNPIFLAEEFTFEVLQMRALWDDREDRRLGDTTPTWLINFGVLYGDVVVDVSTRGMTPEEVWEMLLPLRNSI